MKVLVLFRLPGTTPSYLYCSSDELASIPQRGHSFEWEDRSYTVARTYECLRKQGTNLQVLRLLKLIEKTDDKVQAAMSTMFHIGNATSPGGIVTVSAHAAMTLAQNIADAHSSVMLVKLVPEDDHASDHSNVRSLADAMSDAARSRRATRKDNSEPKKSASVD